jgi:RNA-directed DNA polymerase
LETQVKLCAGRLLHFIVTGTSRDFLENDIAPLIEPFLHERGLELSPEKTRIIAVQESFFHR